MENILGTFTDNFGYEYTLINVNTIDLINHIKKTYSEKFNITDYNIFNFEKHYNSELISPSDYAKRVMFDSGFIVLNSDNKSCFSDNVVLLDGFNRLLNSDAPNVDTLVKVYSNLDIKGELLFYYNLNLYKNYRYNRPDSIIAKDLQSQFFDRGFLLYLTLRTGIVWNNDTRDLLIGYFYSQGGYPNPFNNRSDVFDKMLFENEFLIDDIKLLVKLINDGKTIFLKHFIMMLGAIRAYELFNVKLNDYEKIIDGSIVKGNIDYSIFESYYMDDLVIKNNAKYLEMSETNHNKPKLAVEMFKHFMDGYFLPKYANKEVKVSDAILKARAKEEKTNFYKQYRVLKREHDKEVFEVGTTFYMVYKDEPTAFTVVPVVYSGIEEKAGYIGTNKYHIFKYGDKVVKRIYVSNTSNQTKRDERLICEKI